MPNLLQNSSGYLQTLQNLNLYSPKNVYDLKNSALSNTISAVLSALEGVSVEFTNSLLARVLLPNTPIQQIGNVQLAKALALRASSNLRNLVLPTLNVQETNISFNEPNYWNISNSSEDKTVSGILKTILGYTKNENPIPLITNEFSASDSNTYLKGNRGKGQIDSYNYNILKNNFNPDDENNQYGINNINNISIIKGKYNKSILYKTKEIINDNSIKNGYPSLIEQKGDSINPDALAFLNKTIDRTGEVFEEGNLISKGDGTYTDDTKTKFLRVFSHSNPYASTSDLMKYKHGNAGINSVLQTVYPNIAPLRGEKNVKNLMFSIENLAYNDGGTHNLKEYETGANGGRVMWFPPYGITLNENINVNLNTVDMLGRSEPIYTYNGRERSLNLSFMLIVDYPSLLNDNEWKSNSNNEYDKFFRQDHELKQKYTVGQIDELNVKRLQQTPLAKVAPSNTKTSDFRPDNALKIHYDNNLYLPNQHLTQDINNIGQKDNDDFFIRLSKMVSFLNSDEGKKYKIKIAGFTSKLATNKYNKVLSFFRAKEVYKLIFDQLTDKSKPLADYSYTKITDLVLPSTNQYINDRFEITINGETKATNQNSTKSTFNADVVDRKVMVWLDYRSNLDSTLAPSLEDEKVRNERINQFQRQDVKVTSEKIRGGEYKYFERLKNNDDKNLILQKYSEAIDYFDPVFHSQTPEDINTRLTFLHQCTLQGTSLTDSTINSIFGKPPVCILRLGDFFHTKMLINNVNISYEPLVWDMNPEGIGMQPNLCIVNMECKLIGGQDLSAPLTRLQNALSYNFYANTSVYHKEAQTKLAENDKNVIADNKNTSTKKVISQINNLNSITTNLANLNTGSIASTDGDKTGTISYKENFDDIIQIFNRWTSILTIVSTDIRFKGYLDTSMGLIDINRYSNWFNNLSNTEKANEAHSLGLITAYSADLSGAKNQYFTLYNKLVDISVKNADGKKILNTTDGSLNKYDIMLNNIQNFYTTVVLSIQNNSTVLISKKLAALTKYNTFTVENIPFTS